jgi:uncharacterized membrane protein
MKITQTDVLLSVITTLFLVAGIILFLCSETFLSIIPAWHTKLYNPIISVSILLIGTLVMSSLVFYFCLKIFSKLIKK